MAKRTKEKSYWPHMIMGFLIIGLTLGYWTVKHAASLPVQESNEFMMKYQKADKHINEILVQKARFDKMYRIDLQAERTMHKIENSKAYKALSSVVLHEGKNRFVYRITDSSGVPIADANVTFLLTRPHTDKEDQMLDSVPYREGKYVIENVEITNPGRYTLQLRAVIGDAVGYSEIPAYLEPK